MSSTAVDLPAAARRAGATGDSTTHDTPAAREPPAESSGDPTIPVENQSTDAVAAPADKWVPLYMMGLIAHVSSNVCIGNQP